MKPLPAICLGLSIAVRLCGDGVGVRVPVLVELFTSEGCSSCPPADRLLQKFDRDQPVSGADIVVLSEHVDYWNQLGWKDPFSSEAYTDRQRQYADLFHGDVYTPEMVVDGEKSFVGSNERDARRAIQDAARGPKDPIHIEIRREDKKMRVVLRMDRQPDGQVYLALAHEAMKSQVLRGENAGQGLSHVAVVYSIQKIGKLDREGTGFGKQVVVNAEPGWRAVAFVAKGGVGKVTALGWARGPA